MGFDPVNYAIGKKSSGGGGGTGGTFSEEWDFTSSTPLVGIKQGILASSYNVTFDSSGATFSNTNNGIFFEKMTNFNDMFHTIKYNSITLETKIKSMILTSEENKRFLMGQGNSGTGIVYRNTGVWGFYVGGWEMFSETDGSLFDNSIVKVIVDDTYHWHIYKNGTLLWETTKTLGFGGTSLGSTSTSINNALIEWLKIDAVCTI